MCDDPDYFYAHVEELCEALGLSGVRARDVVSCIQAKGAGYALSRDEELRTIAEVARATGVITDHVYSGKALHALLGEMKARVSAQRALRKDNARRLMHARSRRRWRTARRACTRLCQTHISAGC